MAKRKKAAPKRQSERPGKTRFELRFSDALYERLKRIADEADISFNQFMQGLGQWAASNAIVGEPERQEDGVVHAKRIPGVVFFGYRGGQKEKEEIALEAWEYGGDTSQVDPITPGKVFFTLDFTERRVVRDEDE